MHKQIIFTIIFLVQVSSLFAQKISFKQYTADQGLSQSVVNCLFQDSKGFLWIGTQNGLNKFDGYKFKKYINNPIDSTSISDNWIFDIVEDKNQNLWIGTKNGLNKYDRKKNTFSKIDFQYDKYPEVSLRIYGLDIDNKQNLLINIPPLIAIYNIDNQTFDFFDTNLNYEANDKNEAMRIFVDKENKIWCSSTSGLYNLDFQTKEINFFETDIKKPNSISSDSINCFFEDNNKNIWIGTNNGLNIYNKNTKLFSKYFYQENNENSISSNLIYCIIEDIKGNIWIGTDKGLNKTYVSNTENITFERHESLSEVSSQEGVLSLLLDKSENLWVGTLQGLFRADLKPKKFNLYRKSEDINSVDLLDNVVASLYKDKKNRIWIGNWGKGLNIYNRQTGEVLKYTSQKTGNFYIPNDYIHVIYEDHNENVLIGTRSGVLIFNFENENFIPFQEFFNSTEIPSFTNIRVNSIIQDKKNNYWFGTQNGLYKIDVNKLKTDIYTVESENEPKIAWNYIYELLYDSSGKIWIATSNGLDVFNIENNSIHHFKKQENSTNTLCDDFVVALCEDSDKNIWIGTRTGVNMYNPEDSTFTFYYEDEGLPGNLVYEILEDNKKNLWFATGSGLAKFNKSTQTFRTYTVEEGLQSIEFNLGGKFKSKDGEIFFGGMNGVNSFYPESMKDNYYIPSIEITKFEKLKGNIKEEINLGTTEKIILNYDENAFNVEFTSLEFTNPENNKYAYMLVYETDTKDEWIEIGSRTFVSFSNLPQGDYILKVKGTNNDGIWNETGTSIKIKINPPWWKTKIAITIYIILTITLIFLFIKMREKKLVRERNILEQKVKERTEEINSQKEKIEKAHEEITDSINYASRIQTALLPRNEVFDKYFTDYFIIYKPKDVVSGDFYWFIKIKSFMVFAVADCTGHGVPGAFVSMLGISLLNEIIRREEIKLSGQVLNELRNQIKISLKQNDFMSSTKDGMDIAFCIYNTENMVLDYSGANIPLLLIKNNTNDITHYKPSKNPIGIYYKEKDFESEFIQIEKDDKIYMFSDGIIDQFNDTTQEKFKIRRLKMFLSDLAPKTMEEQGKTIEEEFVKWQGNMYQIDDILMMGIKF